MLRLAHTADLHLGSYLGHGPMGPDGVPLRLRDQVQTWVHMAKAMVEAEINACIFAGDGFRSPVPNPTAIDGFIQGLQVLQAARIPVLMVVGNHDYSNVPGEVSALEVLADEGVTVVREPRLELLTTPGGWPLCQVVCVPYFWRSNLLAREPDLTREQADGRCAELAGAMIHGFVAQAAANEDFPTIAAVHHIVEGVSVGASGFGNGRPDDVHVPSSPLRHELLSYVACGHIHRAQDLPGGIRYCGSPHQLDFSEEGDDKSWTLVEIGASTDALPWPTVFTPVPTVYRPLVTVDVPFEEVEDPTLLQPLRRQLESVRWAEQSHRPIVRLRYTHRRDQVPAIDRAAILQLLERAGAWHVTGLQATCVDSGQVVRVEGLSATLDPVEVARRMLEAESHDPAEIPDLLTKTRELYEEVVRDARHSVGT